MRAQINETENGETIEKKNQSNLKLVLSKQKSIKLINL